MNADESSDRDSDAIEGDDLVPDVEGAHSKSVSDSEEEEHDIIQISEADNIKTLREQTFQISKRPKTSKSSNFEDGANASQTSEAQPDLPIEPTASSSSTIALLGTSIGGKRAEAFAVARQTQLLDALLELRIRFQSAMPLINQVPLPLASVDRLRTSIVSHSEALADDDDPVQVVGKHSTPIVAVSLDDFERLSRPDSSEEFNFATARSNGKIYPLCLNF